MLNIFFFLTLYLYAGYCISVLMLEAIELENKTIYWDLVREYNLTISGKTVKLLLRIVYILLWFIFFLPGVDLSNGK